MANPITLQWLSFNVNLTMVDTWMKANVASAGYQGLSADTQLTAWFTGDPSTVVSAVNTYWSGLSTSSPEAEDYQSAATLAAANAAALASATTKLTNLGLTSQEIAALTGK